MSFTIGRSYGTGRNYKVPNYYVNSQNMQSPGSSTGQPSKTADQPSTERPKTPGTTTPRTSTTIPGGSTTPATPGMTPGSRTTPTTPGSGTTPSGSTSPATPGMTPGSGTTPATPGMTPGSRTTPTTPGMTPGSGMTPSGSTSPATPGMTPGSGTTPSGSTFPATPGITPGSRTTPTTPSMTPGSGTTPSGSTSPATPGMTPGSGMTPATPGSRTTPSTPGMTPGSSTTPATPGMTPGSGTAPARYRNITTPPASDAGSGTAPGSSVIMPETRPGVMPRLVPGIPNPATSTPSGIPGMVPGTTSQELPYFIGSPAEQEDMDMNMPEYMYPNMPTGTPGTTPQTGSGMQPGMPFAPQSPQAPGMPSTPQTPQAPGTPFAPQTPQAPGMPSTPMPSLFPYYQPMPYGTGEMPPMNYPSYQEFPNMYLPNANYGTPMGVPLFPLYGYDNSTDLDRDIDYMKHLYPDTAKKIQSEIDRECDQMEYDGSVMFDEYPDKVYLEKVMERIYDKIKNVDEEPQLEAQSLYFYPVRKRNDYLRDLVSILLLNEIFNRRRHRRARNRWY